MSFDRKNAFLLIVPLVSLAVVTSLLLVLTALCIKRWLVDHDIIWVLHGSSYLVSLTILYLFYYLALRKPKNDHTP